MALQNEVQCSFIESIRYGTYDKYGQIYVNMFQSSNQEAKVSHHWTKDNVGNSVGCLYRPCRIFLHDSSRNDEPVIEVSENWIDWIEEALGEEKRAWREQQQP